MATRDDSLAILEATGPALRRLTGELDDAALDFRPVPAAWSIREVLAHLVDDEAFIMRQRLARIVKEDRPNLAPHDEKRWYASRNTARDARDELLAHLVDDEAFIMRQRLARIVKEDRPDLAPHDEKRWYASRNTARDARDELLVDFQTQRSASLGVARLLSPADWQRVGSQPEYGEFTAEGWLERWADHDTVHLNQIEQTLLAYQQQHQTSTN